jgi:hypothetical protein
LAYQSSLYCDLLNQIAELCQFFAEGQFNIIKGALRTYELDSAFKVFAAFELLYVWQVEHILALVHF